MCISEGYLVELADNSSTNESHVYVTKRYYEQHRELEEFKTAKQVIKYQDLQMEIEKNPWVNVWY